MRLIGQHWLNTEFGKFVLYGFQHGRPPEMVVVLQPRVQRTTDYAEVRVQYGCLAGTAFHSLDCDCGRQLAEAMRRIVRLGCGLIAYFPEREASGAGLSAKIRAHSQKSRKTSSAILHESGSVVKSLAVMKPILAKLGITGPIRLLTSNPDKVAQLEKAGIEIVSVVPVTVRESNLSLTGRREIRKKLDFFGNGLPGFRDYDISRSRNGD